MGNIEDYETQLEDSGDAYLAGTAQMPRWIQRDPTISGNAKLVYLALSSRVGKSGRCWPSHKTLAAECTLSDSTVKRALKELRDLGVVTWESRTRDGDSGMTSNVYTVRIAVEDHDDLGPRGRSV